MKKSLLARMGLRQRDLNWAGRELLDVYCCARAKVTAIDTWLETNPLIDASGNVAPVMRVYLAALNTSVRTLEALRGVVAEMAREDARYDKALAALVAEGRRVREARDEEALDLMHALVLEDGRRWGEAACDFQRQDAEAVLDQASQVPNHFITRPRGDSKTSDLGGMNIAVGLAQAPHRARMYSLAADEKQGRLLVDAMAGFAQRTPELRDALIVRESSVDFPHSQARLEVLAADQTSIWGLRPYLATIDELGQWHTTAPPQRCWEAVSSAAPPTLRIGRGLYVTTLWTTRFGV